jgi:hypothetical protein
MRNDATWKLAHDIFKQTAEISPEYLHHFRTHHAEEGSKSNGVDSSLV